jgi:hypothetical protein
MRGGDGVVVASLALLLAVKMVVFEPVELPFPPYDLVLVAALLPFAMVLGWPGVVALAAGCTAAHVVHGFGVVDAAATGGSVFLGGLAAFRLAARHDAAGLVAGAWILTFAVSLGTAVGPATLGVPFEAAALAAFLRVWVPIHLLGLPLVLALRFQSWWPRPSSTFSLRPLRWALEGGERSQ